MAGKLIEVELRYDSINPKAKSKNLQIPVTPDVSVLAVYPRGSIIYDIATGNIFISTGIEWIEIGSSTILDSITKGDIVTGDNLNQPFLLPVGADGLVLTADSTESSGLKWTAAAGVPALAKGEILSADAGGTATALPIDTNGKILSLDSTQPLGLRWIDAPTAITGTGTTTPGATVTIGSLAVPLDQTCFFDVSVTGYETGANDAVGFSLKALFKNPFGAASQVGLLDILEFKDAALNTATATLTVSGGNVNIVVYGTAVDTISWSYRAELTCV